MTKTIPCRKNGEATAHNQTIETSIWSISCRITKKGNYEENYDSNDDTVLSTETSKILLNVIFIIKTKHLLRFENFLPRFITVSVELIQSGHLSKYL